MDVLLQRLPLKITDELRNLSKQEVAELLGKPPSRSGKPQFVPEFKIQRVLAGHLAGLRIGQIYFQRVTGEPPQIFQLPLEQHEVILTGRTEMRQVKIGSRTNPPSWWHPKDEDYKILNDFEFRTKSFFDQSGVVLFEEGNIQFILPNLVIFQTFYGLSSQLVNAFCNGPWSRTSSQVISFSGFQTGFRTAIDEKTGDWLLVLALGIPKTLAPQIALLWFDPYARRQAEAIYFSASCQNEGSPSGLGWTWFTTATIPHRLSSRAFRMRIKGHELRSTFAGSPSNQLRRFLITSIPATSWSLPKQLIRCELFSSRLLSDASPSTNDWSPLFNTEGRPVDGLPFAEAVQNADPNRVDSTNVFEAEAFTFLDEVLVTPQIGQPRKSSSDKWIPVGGEASPVVSVGNRGFGTTHVAQADIQVPVREPQKQFECLVDALKILAAQNRLEYSIVGPGADRMYEVNCNGLSCWSLVDESYLTDKTLPKTGWEVIRGKKLAPENDVKDTEEGEIQKIKRIQRSRATIRARCVLMIKVKVSDMEMLLIDIEPEAKSWSYFMYAFELHAKNFLERVPFMLKKIRQYRGRISVDEKQVVFGDLSRGVVTQIRHHHNVAEHNLEEKKCSSDGRKHKCLESINEELLFHNLRKAAYNAMVGAL